MESEDLATVPVMTGLTKAPPRTISARSDQNRPEGVKDAEGAVADGQQGEGQDQCLAESHPVGSSAGEEGDQVDPAAEETGDDAGLHVVETDDPDQIGAEGDEGAVVGSALAELGSVAGPEGSRETPGRFPFDHLVGFGLVLFLAHRHSLRNFADGQL